MYVTIYTCYLKKTKNILHKNKRKQSKKKRIKGIFKTQLPIYEYNNNIIMLSLQCVK